MMYLCFLIIVSLQKLFSRHKHKDSGGKKDLHTGGPTMGNMCLSSSPGEKSAGGAGGQISKPQSPISMNQIHIGQVSDESGRPLPPVPNKGMMAEYLIL